MNTKYEKGYLSVNVSELLDCLGTDEKKQLIEHLSCEDDVIKHVVDQIATGWTESCHHGSKGGCDIEPHTALDKARRKLTESANDVCREELASTLRHIKHMKAWEDHYKDWAFEMYHAWGKTSICPHREPPAMDASCEYEVVKKEVAK